MRLDEPLLADYARTFALMKHLGFSEIVIWGFFVSRNWPVDIKSCVTAERAAMINRLISAAHQQGIRVYTGLGVYNWGFETIIKAHPELSRTNSRSMCASLPESWEWMRKVTDFVFERFPIDGASLQSADQGRCECAQCKRYTDTEYHVRINMRVVDYVRSKWPKMTLAVSGWGMDFKSPDNIPPLVALGKKIDYLIDVRDSASENGPAYRHKLIQSLACSFGTLGGPQVEPPQHWARDRWFLPTAKHQGEHLSSLYADGGRACEYFFHILANPGDEVSTWVAGKMLNDPATAWQTHLRNTIHDLYRTSGSATSHLAELFVSAEDAYLEHFPNLRSGTISMEPLIGSSPGPALYLTKHFDEANRKAYRAKIASLIPAFTKLAPAVPEQGRLRKIDQCLHNVLLDIDNSKA